MKIDRQIGILSILLQQKTTTAPELAKKFEVARRTINRDIDDLCKAGIPVVTTQGVGGGISIMEGFSMDRTLLTSKDMKMIMAGLRSLDSVSGSNYYGQLMEKIKPGSSEILTGSDSILIDLSSWGKEHTAPRISLVQDAIEGKYVLSFDYYAPSGEGRRHIEPYYLLFKWSSWYVYGYCLDKEDCRLFKLNRMGTIALEGEKFTPREVPPPELSIGEIFPRTGKAKALVDPSMKWRLVEEYGPDCFTVQEDGRLLFETEFSDLESFVIGALAFRTGIEILEPESARIRLRDIALGLEEIYGD